MKVQITNIERHQPDKYVGMFHVHAVIQGQEHIILYPNPPSHKEMMQDLVDRIQNK